MKNTPSETAKLVRSLQYFYGVATTKALRLEGGQLAGLDVVVPPVGV